LFAHLDKKHGTGNGLSYNGCWGWTHPNGREYAIIGTYTGTSFIDITDSAKEVAFLSGPTSEWREMRTYKNYAYIVSEGGGGTQIVDLAGLPNYVTLVRSYTYTSGNKNTAASHSIEIFDGYLYLNGCSNWNPGGVLIFNLAVPDSPKFVGQYQKQYAHDCYVRNDTLYASAVYSNGGINIADITNKANPVHITKITYSGSGTHNTWNTVDGRYAISTDEIGNTEKTLKFWDLSSLPTPPANPVSTYTINPADIVHNITIRGNYAYVAWYTAGTVVVDITNPLSPSTAGSYDSYPGSSGSYDGVWSIYPYYPSGKIVSNDIETGCYVFQFDHLQPRKPVHLLTPVNNDTVSVGDSILFNWNLTASQLDDPHYYKLEITGDSVHISQRINDTTFTVTNVSRFIPGKTYEWKVFTMDEVNEIQSVETFYFNYGNPVPFSAMSVSTDSLKFGNIRVDSSKTLHLTLRSIGTLPLNIDSIRFSSNVFSTTTTDGYIIQPMDSTELNVKFSPVDSSTHNERMTLYTNVQNSSTYDIHLKGKGILPTVVNEVYNFPSRFSLEQNYPNPFNPVTTFTFTLPKEEFVSLKIFDLLGKEIASVVGEKKNAGVYQVSFNAVNLQSGIYFYKLTAGEFFSVKKMVVLK